MAVCVDKCKLLREDREKRTAILVKLQRFVI